MSKAISKKTKRTATKEETLTNVNLFPEAYYLVHRNKTPKNTSTEILAVIGEWRARYQREKIMDDPTQRDFFETYHEAITTLRAEEIRGEDDRARKWWDSAQAEVPKAKGEEEDYDGEVEEAKDTKSDKDDDENKGGSDDESIKSLVSSNNDDDASKSSASSISSVTESVANKPAYPEDVAGQLLYLRNLTETNKSANEKLRKKLAREKEKRVIMERTHEREKLSEKLLLRHVAENSSALKALSTKPATSGSGTVTQIKEMINLGGKSSNISHKEILDFRDLAEQTFASKGHITAEQKIELRNVHIKKQAWDNIFATISAKEIPLGRLDIKKIKEWSHEDFFRVMLEVWPSQDIGTKKAAIEELQRFIYEYNFASLDPTVSADATKFQLKLIEKTRYLGLVKHECDDVLGVFATPDLLEIGKQWIKHLTEAIIPRLVGDKSRGIRLIVQKMINAGTANYDMSSTNNFALFTANMAKAMFAVHKAFKEVQEFIPNISQNSEKSFGGEKRKFPSQPECVDKRKSFDNKKNAKIPHEAYEKKTSDDSESKLKVCQGCGKNHKLPLTYGQIKDKTKKELETQNPKLTCHFLQHEDFNLTALPFDKTPAGKLFNKLDNNKIGLTWHLKYNAAQNKLVERPKVTKFTNNELDNIVAYINLPSPKCQKIGTLKQRKENEEIATKENATANDNKGKIHNISCDNDFSYFEYLNRHCDKINSLSSNLLTSQNLPIVEGKLTRGNVAHNFKVLIDSGTNSTYVSPTLVAEMRIRPTKHQPVKIRLGEGTIVTASQSVSLKNLFLYQSTIDSLVIPETDSTMVTTDQLHELDSHDDDKQANPFAELVADKNLAPCNPLPYGPNLPPVCREQRRHATAKRKRNKAPMGDNIVGVGPVDIGATILYGIETSGYDLIIGIRDIRHLKLTKVFESLFLEEEIIPLQVSGLTTSANVVSESTSLESKQVQNNNHPNSTTREENFPNERNITPGAINNITTNDIARRNEWTSANTITVPKAALLDPLPPDDDYIDEIIDKSPWEDYFSQSQSKNDNNHEKTLDPITMTLEEIKSLIKIEGTPEEQDMLFKVFDKYLDRFTTTVGPAAALIPPLKLNVDDKKWEEGTKVKYPRPQSAAKTYAVEKFLRQAIADGVIRPSNSPYFSQILLTPKKTPGDWRFCVDYRYLNSCTQAMRWPIPNIASLIERIGIRCNDRSAKLFATLDFTAGYHQAELDEGSRKYTAFIVAGGLYEWCRVPMGPKGSPSYFQSEMINTVFKEQVQRTLEIYIDDLITWAKTSQELADRLDTIFIIMRKWNLTVNPSKCVFNVTSIEYVGHVISTEPTPTISFSDKKLISVGEFELPENQKKLKGFLGLASYFRLHVRDHTDLSKPLHDMLRDYKPRQRIQWNPEQILGFQALKDAVVGCPKLHFLMPGRPVFVQTDASDYGIGAYLFQRYTDDTGQEVETPIGFISKSLDDVQRRWSTIEKEAYAIFYAVMKWEHHLRDIHFTLQTDHRNLTFINVDLKQKVQRWKLAIQEYDFDLQYLKGELNIIADGMSRHCPNNGHGDETNTDKIIQNLNKICTARNRTHDSVLNFMIEIRNDNNLNYLNQQDIDLITPRDYRDYVEEIDQDLANSTEGPEHDPKRIPNDKYKIISRIHNNGTAVLGKIGLVGHAGVNLTLKKVRELLLAEPTLLKAEDTWPHIRQDVTNFVRKCPCCQKMALIKRPIMTRPFTTSSYGLWDQVAMDSIGPLPPSPDGHKYILTIIDTFSRAVELVPLKDLTAESAANAVVTHMGRYGLPCSYLTDNGSQFVNNIITQLCEMLDIKHATIHAYSSEENGIVERCNKEVQRHLRDIIYDTRVITSWPTYLPIVQRILNSAKHSSINMSPMELIYGNTLDLNRGLITAYKEPTTNLNQWVLSQIVAQQTALTVAYEKQQATDMHHIETAYRQDRTKGKRKHSEETNYPINSYVIVEYETEPPSKLHPKLMGPMRVVAKHERGNKPSTYTCEDLVTHKHADFHVKLIHPFLYDVDNVNPENVAMVDGQHIAVQRILHHKFSPKRSKKSSDLSFQVQWEDGTTSWEPYHTTFNLSEVHSYLTTNRMKSLIKSKFK